MNALLRWFSRLLPSRPSLPPQPPAVQDARFGTLTLEGPGLYTAPATWAGRAIILNLQAKDDAELEAALAAARALWDAEGEWHGRIQAFAVDYLLGPDIVTLFDGEPLPTPAELRAQLRLNEISVVPGGGFTFLHDVDEPIDGHEVVVIGTLAEGPTEALIEG